MKRSLIFCLVMLMLGFVPVCGGNVTHSTENLVFGEMWMEGGCRANLIQGLHVEVTNKGTKDYQGYSRGSRCVSGVPETQQGKDVSTCRWLELQSLPG